MMAEFYFKCRPGFALLFSALAFVRLFFYSFDFFVFSAPGCADTQTLAETKHGAANTKGFG